MDTGNFEAAYALAQEAEARVPDDPELLELWPRLSWLVTLESEPPGAAVYRRAYKGTDADWQELGRTPLRDIRIPFGLSRLRLELDGYAPMLRTLGGGVLVGTSLLPDVTGTYYIAPEIFKLDRTEELPEGKVRVSGFDQVIDGASVQLRDYFLDRYEVTNAQFKAFVDAGGYRQPRLWAQVVRDGQIVPWDEAMTLFTDRTGRPGPSTWEAGDYPDGQDEYPVSGVSWYEADAYARFMGQELPTVHHWFHALPLAELSWLLPASNLDAAGPDGGWANRGDELQRHVRHDRQRQRVERIGARRPARDSRRRLDRPGLDGDDGPQRRVTARSIAKQRLAIGRDPRRAGRRGARASCAPAVVGRAAGSATGFRRSVCGVQQSVRLRLRRAIECVDRRGAEHASMDAPAHRVRRRVRRRAHGAISLSAEHGRAAISDGHLLARRGGEISRFDR